MNAQHKSQAPKGYEWSHTRCGVSYLTMHKDGRRVGLFDAPWASVSTYSDGSATVLRLKPVVDGYNRRIELVNERPEYYPERWFDTTADALLAAELWLRGDKHWNRNEFKRETHETGSV